MMKKFGIQFLFFISALVLLSSCKKTNWRENYREREKSPFGTYIIYNEAENLFPNVDVVLLDQNFYDYLFENYHTALEDFGTYVCIKDNANKLSSDGVTELLNFVADGNTAFLSLNNFSDALKEQLQFTTNNLDDDVYSISALKKLDGKFDLQNENFVDETYTFDRNIQRHYFLQYNENKTIVLGNNTVGGEQVPNFIKIYHGKGAVYLHTNPIVFTNYYMLNSKEKYAENVFSYLPDNAYLFWDPQIRRSKFSNESEERNSVFKFFLAHKTLTWFLFVALVGLLLFMLFNARRKQRPVPEIQPLKNTTVAFTQTIASLYLKEQDHKNLVDKKITYFLEKVRVKYLLDTSNLNKTFIKNLASKSGNSYQNTKYLVNTIITLHKKSECSEEELLVLHRMISNFFKNN